MMSIPRDLKVDIPGYGTGQDQRRLRARRRAPDACGRSRSCSRSTGEPFKINHVINVDFGGFRRAIDYIGCVYVDIDRRYFNDNSAAASGYATIDIEPGYQKLCGQDALDYVRYRHTTTTSCAPRASRTSCARRASQVGRQEAASRRQPQELARVVRALLRDATSRCDSTKEIFTLLKLGLFSAEQPGPARSASASSTRRDRRQPRGVAEQLQQTGRRVHEREGLGEAAPDAEPTPADAGVQRAAQKRKRNKPARRRRASRRRRPRARTRRSWPTRKIDFPFYFPTLRTAAPPTPAPSRACTRSATSAARSTTPTGSSSEAASSASTTASRARPGGPADPRRPARRRRDGQRPQAAGLPRRQPAAAGRLADAARPSTGSRTRSRSRSRATRCSRIAASLKRLGS